LALADAANAPAAVLDIPLLFESGWANQCDEIWFVDTAPAIQRAAAEARQWTPQNLELRQSRQLSSQEKRRLSTRIIPNHEGISALKSHVERLWNNCVNSSAIEGPQSAAENHCRPSRTRGH
ncbi:MAG: dephospho-CoA kinase, partial [Planctomycetaceae bacterium]